MKTHAFIFVGAIARWVAWPRALLWVCLFSPQLLVAQGFDLGWFAVGAGGGESSSASYQLTSTIGHPFAGAMAGATYTLDDGFASVNESLQLGQPPFLRITLVAPNSVTISWPASATGWVLQQSSDLGSSASWSDVAMPSGLSGPANSVTLPMAPGNHFFRMRLP